MIFIHAQMRRKGPPTQQSPKRRQQTQNENENQNQIQNENQQHSHPKLNGISAKTPNKDRRKKRAIKRGAKTRKGDKEQGDKDKEKPNKISAGKRKSISFSSTLESTLTIPPSPTAIAMTMMDHSAVEEEGATIATRMKLSPIVTSRTAMSASPHLHGPTIAASVHQ